MPRTLFTKVRPGRVRHSTNPVLPGPVLPGPVLPGADAPRLIVLRHRIFLFQYTRFRELIGHILHGRQRDQKTTQ